MNNVFGIDKVLNYLRDHADSYVVIGGTATKILLEESGLDFRETKDFDIVLLAEASNTEFAKNLVNFLKDGKYQKGFSNGKKICYRFVNPITPGYPKIIELFASQENASLNRYLKKIPIVDDEEQLSAIVLMEDLLNFVKQRRIITKDGLPIVDSLGIIAIKTYAYFENLKLYEEGKIEGKTAFLKHRNDIIRLTLSLREDMASIALPPMLEESTIKFLDVFKKSSDAYKSIPHGMIKLEELVDVFRKVFCKK